MTRHGQSITHPADFAVSQKLIPIIIQVSNPTARSGRPSTIILELTDEDTALKLARKIASETGRGVTVRGEDMTIIKTITAPRIH